VRIALVLLALVVTAPAEAGVRVVAPFDPAEYADSAAVGLLVPGAGPTVTRESALAALVRGELRHGLLGGIAPGDPLIELGATTGPEILVSLPPPGRGENDTRYPIALLGERGLLTSDSTRLDGLVSVTDVATGRLRVVASSDPVEALETLDQRIEQSDRLRLPLTIALAAILIGLALVRPQLALRALLVALAANLWLDPWLAIAAGVAAIALPLGLACAGLLAAYLVSMGLDAETVALSQLGPSQSGRFYGVGNLLETILLVPSLVGAALLGRAGVAAAALALVTIGGNRFGADGGGIVVLAAAYLVLVLRLQRRPPTLRLAAAVATGAIGLALLLLAADAATGGSSHVTEAVSAGPVALANDIADRIELSVRLTVASLGAAAVVLGSLAILVLVALRARRDAVLDAFLVALAVSLVANDTPGDVLGMGAAIAIALALRSPRPSAVSSHAMRRAATLLALLALIALPVGLAGCGGGEEVTPTPATVQGSLPEATTTEATTTTGGSGSTLKGDPANGAKVFASAGCGGCHTLKAAGSSGNVGPNLDDAKPDFALVVTRVTNGKGAMPSFKGQLSDQEIADVAQYVVDSTHG
jgi:mono/diheme cytochrome c family protein